MSGRETRKERKVVTCLFADLVGFTARAESLDPEDVEAILRPYHERLRSELERFGGTVEKFIGDAVMALFGAPIAHEDDPERAVRAALAIRDWARDDGELEVRVGVTTGEALVVLGARPEAGEGMAAGDVVNTASRLQSAAPANGVLVDETTYRATERAIEYRDAEAVAAKGKTEPVRVWEPLEARARFGSDVDESQTPLVGRDHERELLAGALQRAKNERSVQLVTLVGVPGIGKSRLVGELFQLISESPELVTWRQGRSLPYGDGVTFWALGEMVKNQVGILETDTAEQATEKLRAEVARLFEEESESRTVESRLALLLGLATSPEQTQDKRAESFYAWRRFFEELADKRPAVLVFEDLHWADADLLDFVDHLVDWAADVPLLCVCTARPELLERRPTWGGGKPNASTISLSPLSDEETARLLATLLEQTLLPAEQQTALLTRAGGNPLYAEQFARMLTERGAGDDLPLPETVQGIIAARLDGLEPEEKVLLQDAAVLGKVFWAGAVAQMDGRDRAAVEQSLHTLARKEFVRRQRRPSVEGESEYAFLHLLVRDVAYGQIPRAARSEKHRAVADWMSALGREEEHSEVLAYHYQQALEYARSAGGADPALEERARLVFRTAGDRALALNAFATAARFYRLALDLWPRDDPDCAYVLFGLGVARNHAEFSVAELEEARDELLRQGDREKAAEAEAIVAFQTGSTEESLARLEQTLELVRDRPPSRSKAFVLAQLAYRAASLGEPSWEQHAEDALAMAEDLGLEDLRALVLLTIGTARSMGTARSTVDVQRGIEALEQAVMVADAIDSLVTVRARTNLAAQLQTQGELQHCFDVQAKARSDAERFGVLDSIVHLRSELVWELYWRGRWDDSIREANACLAEIEAGGRHSVPEIFLPYVRARIRLARDDLAGSICDGEQAVRVARDWPTWGNLGTTLAGLARLLLAGGRNSDADTLVTEVGEIGLNSYGWPDLSIALVGLGRGDELAAAADLFPGPSAWIDAAKAFVSSDYLGAADLYAGIGSLPDEADARLRSGIQSEVRRALEFYLSVGATRYIREGEALLAASA